MRGGGLQHVSVLLIKAEEHRMVRVPHLLSPRAALNLQGQGLR